MCLPGGVLRIYGRECDQEGVAGSVIRKAWAGMNQGVTWYPKRLGEVMPSTKHLGLIGMPNLGKQFEIKRPELCIKACRLYSLA